jgi:undecaprenyl-diphosphatase
MDILHIAILSIIEGLTEFLPISSTAHLILTSHLLQIPQSDFLTTFEIAIQVGAIAAVVVVYYKRILANKPLFYKACVGFIPTGILGFLLFKHIKALLTSSIVPVIALFIGGLVIIAIEMFLKKSKHKMKTTKDFTYKDALLVGLMQSISMIPGVSRSAASIFGGMALRLDREATVEFSFLLAIPTMIAATGLDLVKEVGTITSDQIFDLILGTMIAFVVALLVIKWLLKYVQKNNFIGFGIYRIVLAILYFLIFMR